MSWVEEVVGFADDHRGRDHQNRRCLGFDPPISKGLRIQSLQLVPTPPCTDSADPVRNGGEDCLGSQQPHKRTRSENLAETCAPGFPERLTRYSGPCKPPHGRENSSGHRRVWRLRHRGERIAPGKHDRPGGPSGWDVVFNPGQRTLHQFDSFISGQQVCRGTVFQQGQRCGQPMCGLLLVAEYCYCMSDHWDQAGDYTWGRHNLIVQPGLSVAVDREFRTMLAAGYRLRSVRATGEWRVRISTTDSKAPN